MKKQALYILFLLGVLTSVVSCQDENIIDDNFDPSLKGTSEVSFNLEFKPLTPALESRTAGDAIKHINDLNIVIYSLNGEDKVASLYKHFFIQRGSDNKLPSSVDGLTDISETESNENYPESEKGEEFAESTTCRASFKYSLPYGQYKIIAVANCGKLTNDEVTSENSIRNKQLTWNADNVASNNQMFGFFSTSTDYKDVICSPDATEIIKVQSATNELHAWLKRAASKVTVAYNGSKLNDNVFITIKSVQIKQIPVNCKLGYDYAVEDGKGLIEEGEKIAYAKSANDNGPVISKGGVNWGTTHIELENRPYDPSSENGEAHTETSQALFFYENLQGYGEENTLTDKSVNQLIYMDKGKSLGTYIEVEAFYENKNQNDVSSGIIFYRFMLGKDIKTDYNAERNYHYKLTLYFKNDANDVDWRIYYNEEKGIYVPNPYYISYLYNQTMNLPLKVVIDQNDEITSLKAEIIENNWEPDGDASALGGNYYGNSGSNLSYSAMGSDGNLRNGQIGAGNTEIEWLGFLSLKDEYVLNDNKIYLDGGFDTDITLYRDSKKPHEHWDNNELGVGKYSSTRIEESTGTGTKSVLYEIPFYTRVKQLYSVSGFTGNNPYVGYNRTAKVKFIAETKNGNIYDDTVVKIIQVKRLVNPTGIWRDKDNSSSFNVVLKEQEGYGGDFKDLISDGPWSATIKAPANNPWFTISKTSGVTGSKVAFTYKPNGTTTTPRCGIIEVKYHNNTCTHLIFVRQGYDPISIHEGQAKWYSFNMKTSTQMAKSPLDEGSLYRYGKWDYPIAEVNNVTDGLKYGENPGDKTFVLQDKTDKSSWSEIGSDERSNELISPITGTAVATEDDWYKLKDGMQGYGVLYADDATDVATTTTEAYGYRAAYTGADSGKRGMRGVFAYNETTGANVFFPIGAMGYGHRKQETTNSTVGYGVLRYGTQNYPLTSNQNYRPMLYGLYAQNGAIYWTSTDGNAWDINFDQLDFNIYDYGNAWTDGDGKDETANNDGSTNDEVLSDACFIRLVVEK